jgi:hypothetical protein
MRAQARIIGSYVVTQFWSSVNDGSQSKCSSGLAQNHLRWLVLGCREVEDDTGHVFAFWLGPSWFGVRALFLCRVSLGSEASKHCIVCSKSVQYDLLSSQYHCLWGCKRCCCCKGVVVEGFSSVLTIAHKASGPSQLLLVACVIRGTAVAFRRGLGYGVSVIYRMMPSNMISMSIGSVSVVVLCLRSESRSFFGQLDLVFHLMKWVWSSTGCWQDWHSLGYNVALYLAAIFPVASHPYRNLRRNVALYLATIFRVANHNPFTQSGSSVLDQMNKQWKHAWWEHDPWNSMKIT